MTAPPPLPAWDGTTWDGASLPDASVTRVSGYGPGAATQPLRRYRPAIAPPPPLTVVSVTVGDGHDAGSAEAARVHAALTYIRLKVAVMEHLGHAARIDDSEHARRRGDPVAPRSDIAAIRREATALLCGNA